MTSEYLKDSEEVQYIKSLGNGEHLLYDSESETFEVWFANNHHASFGYLWNNTKLEYVRKFHIEHIFYTDFKIKMDIFTLKRLLPHGSGIDCDWKIEDKGKYFKCQNAFHCMNENGYYCGYADFTVIIPKRNPQEFNLHFNGWVAQRLNQRHFLRDHLEETLYWSLKEKEI